MCSDAQCMPRAALTSVLLESEAVDGNLLLGDGVEHGADHPLNKTLLLVVIHEDDLQQRAA